jgi:hypothetical protein
LLGHRVTGRQPGFLGVFQDPSGQFRWLVRGFFSAVVLKRFISVRSLRTQALILCHAPLNRQAQKKR